MTLLNVAIYDAMVAAWDSKYFYKRSLPSQVDRTFQPLVTHPNVPSYPNEFAAAAGAAAASPEIFLSRRLRFHPVAGGGSSSITAVCRRRLPERLLRGASIGRSGGTVGGATGQIRRLRCGMDWHRPHWAWTVDTYKSNMSALRYLEDLGAD
jgi:hypothetical protein